MAKRVLVGNRSTGGYGLYVSKSGSDVTTCNTNELTFWTDSGETGSNFVAKGIHQTVPFDGGLNANNSPVATIDLSSATTAPLSFSDLGPEVFAFGGFIQGSANPGADSKKGIYFTSTDSDSTVANRVGVAGTFKGVIFKSLSAGEALY